MKKVKKLFILLIVSSFLILPNVYADDNNYLNISNDTGKTVDHSMFSAGEDVSTNNKIKGIDFSAGNTLNISGSSEYGMFAGNSINFKGIVTRDLFIVGNQIVIDSNANIARDLYIAGNSVTISSNIKGNIFLIAKDVSINSKEIDGNISLAGDKLTIANDTKINGTLKYNDNIEYSKTNANIKEVKTYHIEDNDEEDEVIPVISNIILGIVTSFLVALVIYLLLPNSYKVLDEVKKDKVLKTFGNGFLFLIAVPFISIVLIISIIGIPLGIIALVLYGIIIYLSSIISSVYFGKLIGNKLKLNNIYLQILIGVVITKLVKLIPVISGLYSVIIVILGVGLIYNMMKKLHKKAS